MVEQLTPHVEGILHLASIAVVASIAYLGLDRIHQADQGLEKELRAVRDKVDSLIVQLEAISKNGKLIFAYDIPEMYILCHVAGTPVKHGLSRPWRFICRQRHVPLLSYFRGRKDRIFVGALCSLSTMIFLLLIASTIWEMGYLVSIGFAKVCFIWFTGVLVWILLTVGASYRLRRIGAVCNKLETAVNKRLDEIAAVKLTALNRGNQPQAQDTAPTSAG